MFVGHLAAALAATRVEPRVPLGAAVGAAFGLDLLWPLFLLAGIESVNIHPDDTAFTHLEFVSYPWSHSLLLVVGWSVLTVVVARAFRVSTRAAALLGALVLSHWALDWLTHRPDLPLWPGGPVAGLGLWYSIPATILVEGGLFVVALWLYTRSTRARDAIGRWGLAGLIALSGTVWITQPWSPPPPSPTAIAWGGLVMFLLPVWAGWIASHRTTAR